MNKTKRVLSVVLAVLMLSSLIAALAIAEGQHTVVINYVFQDGKQAASPWTATLAEGSNYLQTVVSPMVVGYEPDQASIDVAVSSITENKIYTVTYKPAEVNFTVKHYLQNVDNDNYADPVVEITKGYTESAVEGSLAKSYTGFTALLYDTTTKIAADGSTVVEIYYDRNYYMMSFNLDGGYGVEPIYARYGTPISLGEPTKAGYTFKGWEPAAPATMPVNGGTHTAQWQKNNANYTVQYWQENADDDGYSYKESTTKSAPSGNAVSGTDDKTYAGFTYNAEKTDKNIIVKGDGSTVVNVYYKRNVYDVKFYKWQSSGLFGGDWVEDASLRITAKYGAFIGNKWPGGGWYVDTNGDTSQSYLSIMPLNGKNFYDQQTGSHTATATYYVEVLPGESGTLVGGKYYKEHHKDTAKYNKGIFGGGLTVTDEDRYDIAGYTCNKTISTKNGENYNGAKFYYDRNKYKLEFNDNFDHSVSDDMFFEQQLKESPKHKAGYKPAYPSGLEAGAYDFGGWYIDKSCTEQVNWEAKMPATNLIVYAKWAPKTHTVRTFLTKEKIEEGEFLETYHVPHGTAVTNTPEDPPNGSYVFVGWFYEENGVEKAFDFSMPIVKDLNLYAKWSSNTLVTYTIKYVLEKDGTTVIADETTGSALAGTTKTFDAKTGTDLYESYQSGYFPTTNSHSIDMKAGGDNTYTFKYVARDSVNYTVKYLEKGTNKVLHEEKHGSTKDAVITEKFEPISGYVPDALQKRLVLSANEEENVIEFLYTKDEGHALVEVIHWTQNAVGDGYTEYARRSYTGNINSFYSENPQSIEGYTYAKGTAAVAGIVTKEFTVGEKLEAQLTDKGLTLNLYYDRVMVGYIVKHIDVDTGREIVESEPGEARYGARVIGYAKNDIEGYMLTDGESQQKAIDITLNSADNVITFRYHKYYKIAHVQNYKVVGTDTIRLTGSKANLTAAVTPGYLYGGAFDNVDCTTVHDFGEENAINFTPVKGKKYYIWEVSETYLKPRAYVVSRHDPDNNGGYNVVGLYLTSSVDRNMYSEVGFTVDGTNFASDGGKVYDKVQAVYTDGSGVKEEMYVMDDGVWDVQAQAPDSRGGYVSIYTVSMNTFYKKSAASPLSYQPYWVTLDGIKVTGAYAARTCYYQGVGNGDIGISNCVDSDSAVSIYRASTTNTIGVESVAVLSAAPETVQPEVPVTPEIPEVPEAPDMTLNSGAMYLRAQYTYEMMTNTVKFISAIDVNECIEYGFVINGEVVKCEEAAETVDGYDANYLFGGSVNGAMLMSCNMLLDGLVDGMTLNVTPYYVALDGTVVYGETRTLVYRQWVGLEG